MPDWHEIVISSTPHARQEAEDTVFESIRMLGFDPEAAFSIKLAMEEAITNAIKHGNRFDRDKKVVIRWACNHTSFTMSVRDEGRGFDPKSVPDPTRPENLGLPYGRGLMLIQAYMDRVEYNDRGNEVTMIKRFRPE